MVINLCQNMNVNRPLTKDGNLKKLQITLRKYRISLIILKEAFSF